MSKRIFPSDIEKDLFNKGDIVIALEDGEDGAYCILADKCDSIEYNVHDYGIASAKDLIEVE